MMEIFRTSTADEQISSERHDEWAPSPGELRDGARAMQPALRARADEANHARDVPAATIDEFRRAGLFRMLRPRSFGGLEADPRDFFDVQNAIAEACASSAWVYGVLSVQYLLLATFDPRAQHDVLGSDPDVLVSSSFAPRGTVTHEGDGYRLSGRWSFSSGCTHAGWSMVGAIVPPADVVGTPEMRLFLVPKADLQVDNVWNPFGLRATGSHDLLIDGAFVPDYRTVIPKMGLVPLSGADAPRSLLHRIPWFYIFTATVANIAIGITRGAVASFVTAAEQKVNGSTGKAAKDDVLVRQAAAESIVAADACETLLRRHIASMRAAVLEERAMAASEGALFRAEMTTVARTLARKVDAMQALMGARGLAMNSPLVQAWLDLMAVRNHPGNDPSHGLEAVATGLFADRA